MVARIRSGKSLKGAINYNEHKIKEGKAEMIAAKGYAKNLDKLNFHDKLNRLQRLADLNTRATTHCLHVSLNFDPAENLSKEKLQQIAETYMKGIGFDRQPYLVYQHHDSAHQHVHIVSTNIQMDGKRISMHNLGRDQSEKTRKEMEVKFGLVKAGDRQQKMMQPLKPVKPEKVQYGKTETKRAISNIVTQVVSQYKFASLPEFNAALMQFNIIADRGGEGTRMFENKGLQYSIIDEKGNKVGVPVKASSVHDKPTLANLEAKYERNKQARQPFSQQLKSAIDTILEKQLNQKDFLAKLKQKGIDTVLRRNADGFIYGITYVDHNSKAVFNGSELGKQYSAAVIREKLEVKPGMMGQASKSAEVRVLNEKSIPSKALLEEQTTKSDLLQTLTDTNKDYNYLPYELRKKRKRKKRKLGL